MPFKGGTILKEKDVPLQILKEFTTVLNFSIGKHTGLVTPKNREILTNARDTCLRKNGEAIQLLRKCFRNIVTNLTSLGENEHTENLTVAANDVVTAEINKLVKALYVKP